MLQTDLSGVVNEVKNNKLIHLLLIFLGVLILFQLVSKYLPRKNNFENVLYGTIANNGCKGDIPKIDEAIIRNMIDLPNRNPAFLTSSMVLPEKRISDEDRRKTRMEVLNMFYSTLDDDTVGRSIRPQGLYIIP